ncbi:MAG: thrombospondin type 3 repeat-containing protein, partial [Armatimonadetes bacterium]|nr:thrombospondin type 3 repeat-containing protein [Armatimonadota bacterium]
MLTKTNKTNGRNGSTATSLRAHSLLKALTMIAVVALARVASAGPEIQVSQLIVGQAPIEVAEGGFSDFPPTEINETTFLFYSIENTGDEDLVLDGAGLPELVQVLEGISGFSVLSQPNGFPIPAGFSTTFRLRFSPTTAATRTARVFIFSNAVNTVGPFDFTLRGTGFEDCNDNDLPDTEDIADGLDEDCNFNNVPDVCENDTDGDGFIDECDECPGEDDLLDTDGDTVPDCLDNCPDDANTDQLDSDGNGLGDVCQEEVIVDCNSNGVADEFDVTDETSYDGNTNGTPDECEVLADTDGDTVADGCDLCPGEDDLSDTDGDEYPDCLDNCPETANPDQLDSDSNGLGDACEVEEEEPLVCTDEYLPVCGMDAMTYDNACYADEAGMGIAYEGACEVVTPPGDEDEIGDDEIGDDEIEAGREIEQAENNNGGGRSAGM